MSNGIFNIKVARGLAERLFANWCWPETYWRRRLDVLESVRWADRSYPYRSGRPKSRAGTSVPPSTSRTLPVRKAPAGDAR